MADAERERGRPRGGVGAVGSVENDAADVATPAWIHRVGGLRCGHALASDLGRPMDRSTRSALARRPVVGVRFLPAASCCPSMATAGRPPGGASASRQCPPGSDGRPTGDFCWSCRCRITVCSAGAPAARRQVVASLRRALRRVRQRDAGRRRGGAGLHRQRRVRSHGPAPLGRTPTSCASIRDGTAALAAADLVFPNGSVITNDGSTLIVSETMGSRHTAFTIRADGSARRSPGVGRVARRRARRLRLDERDRIWCADALGKRCVLGGGGGRIVDEVAAPSGLHVYAACSAGRMERRCCSAAPLRIWPASAHA